MKSELFVDPNRIRSAFGGRTPEFDYKSPIEMSVGELQTQIVRDGENEVIKAVQKIGINVDREELIRALEYDRRQYEKGFEDGYAYSRWIPVEERLPENPGKYLVTVKNGNVYAGTFDAYSGQFQGAVLAWMPLPSPYTAESEE